jgi:hypothetical protein
MLILNPDPMLQFKQASLQLINILIDILYRGENHASKMCSL